MVWPQGGLSGLAWDGKDKCINLMPRSLRWHSLWHTYRYYLYSISLIYFMVGLVSIYMCWNSYGIYDRQKVEYLNLRANAQYQAVEQKYNELMAIKQKILKNTSDSNKVNINQNSIVLYILDTAMAEHISLQHLSIKDGHISIDGIGVSDESCRKFIGSLQQRLSGMECHGTVKADKGIYTFHMDGSKREHRSTNQQDTNDRSPVGDNN